MIAKGVAGRVSPGRPRPARLAVRARVAPHNAVGSLKAARINTADPVRPPVAITKTRAPRPRPPIPRRLSAAVKGVLRAPPAAGPALIAVALKEEAAALKGEGPAAGRLSPREAGRHDLSDLGDHRRHRRPRPHDHDEEGAAARAVLKAPPGAKVLGVEVVAAPAMGRVPCDIACRLKDQPALTRRLKAEEAAPALIMAPAALVA